MTIQRWAGQSLAMTAELRMPLALSLHINLTSVPWRQMGASRTLYLFFFPTWPQNIAVFCFSPLPISLIDVILLQSR